VIGGEVVLEVYHVAFEVVGVAEKYEFHCFSWLDLMVVFVKLVFFLRILSIFGACAERRKQKIVVFYKNFTFCICFLSFRKKKFFLRKNNSRFYNSLTVGKL
jgi:hypothetical protein